MTEPWATLTPSAKRNLVLPLWQADLSAADIASQLGISRNSVLSVARRGGFPEHQPPREHRMPVRVPADPWQPLAGVEPIHLVDLPLRGRCRWPVGSRLACGAASDGTYCETHHALAYKEKPRTD